MVVIGRMIGVRMIGLGLRPYREEDRRIFLALVTDPDVMRHMDGPRTDEQAVRLFQSFVVGEPPPGLWVRAAVETSTGRYIGHAFLAERNDLDGPEAGYIVRPRYQGRGIGTYLVKTLVHVAFTELGHARVVATVDLDHVASRRVLEKAGFHLVEERHDEQGPYHVYAIERDQGSSPT